MRLIQLVGRRRSWLGS